jgi:NAD(P)-dependent dehydrogenase (short-subunit alcohol dehydrogenase family)
MADEVVLRWGGIDGLVHSAYWTRPTTLLETSINDWQRTLDVTLKGAFLLAKACIPKMQARGGGVIVPIASVHSLVGFPEFFAYQVAKAGLLGFVRSVATDYAPTIRCNAVAPGAIQTPALNDASPEVRRAVTEGALLKRVGTAHDVARSVIYLLSEESAFMTGSTLVLDGGWTAV